MTEQASDVVKNRVVIILSGGMDSSTLLYKIINEGKEVFAISFNYGQKHSKELEYAKKTCEKLKIDHNVIDLSNLSTQGLFGESSLTSKDEEVPEGHYADETMKSTVVPNRNMLMLSMGISYAISNKAESIYYGAHAGDHAIYPDCRPIFIERMQQVAAVCHYYPIKVIVPYENYTKGDIIKEGIELNVDYSLTWTCYKGEKIACGKCGSCVERLEAFEENNITDPLQYEK